MSEVVETPSLHEPGGYRELLRLAWPLVVSNSFWTLQITIDRVLLSWYDTDAVSASMMTAMLFWTPFVLLQMTAGYVATFVAQYVGANRPQSVGPIIWQSLYFCLFGGVAFLLLIPLGGAIVALTGHDPRVMEMERIYFECLCWMTLPALLTVAVSAFFSGRGDSFTVMLINGVGLVTNVFLDYALIFGHFGFAELGIAGAGWATVAASWVSAIVALIWMFRHKLRHEYALLTGYRFVPQLFGRLMYFGIPAGLQWALEMTAFTMFILILGWWGRIEQAASSITFTISTVAFLPMLGVGQAVTILVGQALGRDRPDTAERSTWRGFYVAWSYMLFVGACYLFFPAIFVDWFAPQSVEQLASWPDIQRLSCYLMGFLALYSLFDGINLIFSFALRGAGDTRFVTLVALCLAWPTFVLPTWISYHQQWPLAVPWICAAGYMGLMATIFYFRFRGGKWRSMRVIEPPVVDVVESAEVSNQS